MAKGSRVTLALEEEVTPGTWVNSAWVEIRKTGDSLTDARGVVESAEIRADREDASDVDGNLNVNGDINCELLQGAHPSLWESALFDAWVDNDTTAQTISVATPANTFTRSAGDYTSDGFAVGQWARTEGFTNAENNGWWKIITLTATVMTVAPPEVPFVTEAGGGDERVSNSVITGGITATYLSLLKRFEDIAEEVVFTGCLVDQVTVSMEPEAIVPLVFTVNGRGVTGPQAVGSAPSSPSTANPMASFSGLVYLDNILNQNVVSINWQLANNIQDGFVVGSQFKVDQFEGRRQVSGDLGFYFNDLDEYTTTQGHTARDLGFSAGEGTTYFGFTMPRTYIDLTVPEVADEGPLTMTGPFRSKLDSTLAESIIISTSIT